MLLPTVLILAGCASSQVTIPEWSVEPVEISTDMRPLRLPLLCEIPWTTTECWAAVEQYEVVAESNTTIAQASVAALQNTEAAYNHLVEAGKLHQQFAEVREEMLVEEKRQHTLDVWTYRAIVAAITIAAVL